MTIFLFSNHDIGYEKSGKDQYPKPGIRGKSKIQKA
jgi:hypothetical protein